MAEITADQGVDIRKIVLLPVGGIVVPALVMEPHIPAFVHQVDAQRVAGLQHGAGTGIMGGTDGVEAGVLQLLHAAPFGFVPGRRAQDAAVVMDAAAPKERFLPVDQKSLRIPKEISSLSEALLICAV